MKKLHPIFIGFYLTVFGFLFLPIKDSSISAFEDMELFLGVPVTLGIIISLFVHYRLYKSGFKGKTERFFVLLTSMVIIIFIASSLNLLFVCDSGLGGLGCGLLSIGIIMMDSFLWVITLIIGLIALFKKPVITG